MLSCIWRADISLCNVPQWGVGTGQWAGKWRYYKICASAVKFGIVLAVAHILVHCVLCRVENFSYLHFAQIYCWGLSAGYQPRPQVVDRGTTARYGGQLRYI